MKLPDFQLPDSLQEGRLEYRLFSQNPLVFGWILTLDRDVEGDEERWLNAHDFVRITNRWYRRESP